MKSRKNKTAALVLLSSLAFGLCSCGDDLPPKQKGLSENARGLLAKVDVDLLGPEFRQAVEEYGNKKGVFHGLAIISSRPNLVLVSVDLGDHTQRAWASMYFGESAYWKVEDLNESNRNMLVLLKADASGDDHTDPREEANSAQ
jgi:hypothetical protein